MKILYHLIFLELHSARELSSPITPDLDLASEVLGFFDLVDTPNLSQSMTCSHTEQCESGTCLLGVRDVEIAVEVKTPPFDVLTRMLAFSYCEMIGFRCAMSFVRLYH
jgi:hypothetical protein